MLVGPTGGGKTSNYKTLAMAQSELKKKGVEGYETTHYHILNPKSITMEQLYGGLDPSTNEWNDGIAAILVAEASKDESPDKHWIMFDGPVDALWIESMNTVLDDNKKLCLNSGAIINLTPRMTMMFEVEDLAVASPATVSRCGMIYMEPEAIGIQPLVQSWILTLPASMKLRKTTIPIIEKLFEKYFEPLIKYVRKNCPEPVMTVNNNLACSFFRLMDCFLVPFHDTELKKVTPEEVEVFEGFVEGLFIFVLTWTIGATTNLEGRAKFNIKIKEIMGKDNKFKHPTTGTVYDYMFIKETLEWRIWTETVSEFSIDPKAIYSEIIVPTFDSIRMKFVKGTLVREKKHCLSPGPTGTGKTVNIAQLCGNEMSEDYSYVPVTFSAQTSANLTQDTIDSKVEKRRKGIYGPPVGKRLIFFVDDLNMPKKEEYGAQPPIEILRQWMDHKGWYSRVTKEFMQLQDIIFICAMGPPGGGRSVLTQRLQRHFNIITYSTLDQTSIEMIFNKIVGRFLGAFAEDVKSQVKNIVDATNLVYQGVEEKLKPIPAKSHYTFNLRDMSKIFQGVCAASPKFVLNKVDLLRLWVHENQRVFGDRMICEEDKNVLLELLMDQAERKFETTKEKIFE
jgi:dynein heavy chain